MSLSPVNIEATNLPDSWFQTLYKSVEIGRDFTIDRGSFAGQKRKEFDFVTIHIKCPDKGDLLPKLNPLLNLPDPVEDDYLDGYMPYLMTGEEKKGESYTYGQRIVGAQLNNYSLEGADLYVPELFADWLIEGVSKEYQDGKTLFIDQMSAMIWTYKNKGYRNNQMIMQVGQPSDMALLDPPCLRHIDTRIQDGALHFFPYFRSWDLWGGFPANLAAIELMKQYCAEQIGVKNGEIIASSKGLHLYDYVFELAEAVRGKSSEEFKNEMKG